jgi:hypothetical protein
VLYAGFYAGIMLALGGECWLYAGFYAGIMLALA